MFRGSSCVERMLAEHSFLYQQRYQYVHFSHVNSYFTVFVHYCLHIHNSLHMNQTIAVRIGGNPGHERKNIQRTHLPYEVLNIDVTSKFDPL